ncbi:MAG: glycosyltransferase, partial [Acidobacteriota bacterium]|nr:glycosyltransferase [Acidobacteriota bacterium]
MKLTVFGLSISSAWGNGHATLLRGLFRALHAKGHEIHFFERDTPYYAAHRDAPSLPYVNIHLYHAWSDSLPLVRKLLAESEVAMVTSYCPDGAAACELVLDANVKRSLFYDLDTPVTLSRLAQGEIPSYLPAQGLAGFDLVLSYTGGEALGQLSSRLGARTVASLYGWVDPEIHSRVPACPEFRSDLSYLGTYAADRQKSLEDLLIKPARELP